MSQWFLMSKGITEKQVPPHTEAGFRGCHWSITGLCIMLTEHEEDKDYITMVPEKLDAECVNSQYSMLQPKYLRIWKANCDAHRLDGALPNLAIGLSPSKAYAQEL